MIPDPLFPIRQPRYARQMAVGDGHLVYVEECVADYGLPVLFLHGGPGSGCSPVQRRLFDPQRFHAVLFDQRGCGRSKPLGSLRANTTAHLVTDLEYLREALGIPAWIVFGGSWGSLLALTYAQLYPERVLGLVLRGIFLGSAEEIRAYVQGGNGVPPEAWQAFAEAMPAGERGDLLAAYTRRILGDDLLVATAAAHAWLDYERAQMGEAPLTAAPDAVQLAKARIQLHYLSNHCFLNPGQLLAGVDRLRHIPATIVQGMADPVCPPHIAEKLHRAWPEATWMPVAGAGHGGLSPPIAKACIKALGWVAECVEG
ncbi:prolyl aminopeptidase [Dechloromonas sp. A34]|uniref:prolyl aminopeptidase n=1 Tax=Dechloromonas sp. A34 TaxID=447588 RepID=UPI0022492C7A|nr:prolyl aminopeptidase [Dechloromonas sp. A34]